MIKCKFVDVCRPVDLINSEVSQDYKMKDMLLQDNTAEVDMVLALY